MARPIFGVSYYTLMCSVNVVLTTFGGLVVISVNPTYQHRGIGSLLMQWACKEADQTHRDGFVMAFPAAFRLYTKFGFEKMGEVKIENDVFQSMFRKARSKTEGSMFSCMTRS